MSCSVELVPVMNIEVILDRVGGDMDLLREIAAIFLEEYPGLLNEIREGLREGNPSRVERAAHSLKGSALNFDVAVVTDPACHLEMLGRQKRLEDAPLFLAQLEAGLGELAPELISLTEDSI